MTFSGTKEIIEPTVFNLQASDWLHCEEEIGAHLSMCQFSSKLVSFFNFNFESCLFGTKKYVIFKKFPKIYF